MGARNLGCSQDSSEVYLQYQPKFHIAHTRSRLCMGQHASNCVHDALSSLRLSTRATISFFATK